MQNITSFDQILINTFAYVSIKKISNYKTFIYNCKSLSFSKILFGDFLGWISSLKKIKTKWVIQQIYCLFWIVILLFLVYHAYSLTSCLWVKKSYLTEGIVPFCDNIVYINVSVFQPLESFLRILIKQFVGFICHKFLELVL